MSKYQRDPNKDYNIEIYLSEIDNPEEKVVGKFKLSQINELAKFNIDGISKMMTELIIQAERAEADKLGQSYNYFGYDPESLPQV
jgi:hypothetical protein